MSLTVLVASTPIPAHTLNATKIVTGLVGAGHRVLWYADAGFAGHVARCGAEHVVPSTGPAAWHRGTGLARVRSLYREQVVGQVPDQMRDLAGLGGVDLVVSDTLLPAAGIHAALHGVPWATVGDGPLLWWDESTPPFGTGLAPMAGPRGEGRNRRVQAVIDRVLFAAPVAALNQLRQQHGLAPVSSIRDATLSPVLHLQGCTPGFEYPRDPLPGHVRFVGALGPGRAYGPEVPEALRRPRERPLALVTQGTLRPDVTELVRPACRALVAEGFDVLVAGAADGGWNRWPGRVTAMERVDYEDALAEADLFVTNGGYTGVTLALAAGVPVVQAGGSEEKPDIGARVAWVGVGASIRLTRPPAWLLRRAVARVMTSVERRDASARLAAENDAYDAADRSATLLTALAAHGARR